MKTEERTALDGLLQRTFGRKYYSIKWRQAQWCNTWPKKVRSVPIPDLLGRNLLLAKPLCNNPNSKKRRNFRWKFPGLRNERGALTLWRMGKFYLVWTATLKRSLIFKCIFFKNWEKTAEGFFSLEFDGIVFDWWSLIECYSLCVLRKKARHFCGFRCRVRRFGLGGKKWIRFTGALEASQKRWDE